MGARRPTERTRPRESRRPAARGCLARDQTGGSSTRLLSSVLILAAIAYLASVFLPVVIATFRFSQAMDHEVLYGTVNEQPGLIERRLLGKAASLGLPITAEQIVVRKNGANFQIDADYTVPVSMLGNGVAFDWRFQVHKEGTRRPPAFGQNYP